MSFCPELADYQPDIQQEAQTRIKYEGYLKRQQEMVCKFQSLEKVTLPPELDYQAIPGLTREAAEKLSRIQPQSLGQAKRISGITPAALSCLEIQLKKMGRI